MKTVFIDGKAGTTGLRIYERLESRDDIKIITLSDEERKDIKHRKEALNSCDIAFLCLPDDAAREAVSLTENLNTVIIDTSTAHRVNPDWAYGFPELDRGFYEKIINSKRIAVPGCHAAGFVALVYPLIKSGILSADSKLFCHSITGYSGGGKKMIAEYENDEVPENYSSPRQYSIGQNHKHLKEMKGITGLADYPVFCPVVSNFYSGMELTVPLFADQIKGRAEDIKKVYSQVYNGETVTFSESLDEGGFIPANGLKGYDGMKITVSGNDERILLIALFDNLGKGASGTAVECMNLCLGEKITKGLNL